MGIKRRIYEILFNTREGDRTANAFFFFIFTLIILNIVVGIIESDRHVRVEINTMLGFADSLEFEDHGEHATPRPNFFYLFELVSVLIFTVEYVLRLWSCTASEAYKGFVRGRAKLAREPLLIVDLVAIAPFYIQLLMPAGIDLRFVRVLRLFRIFRLFRSSRLAAAFALLSSVIYERRNELLVSVVVVVIAVILAGSVIHIVEKGHKPDDPEHFHSVPQSMWWAIVTVTTIGYGDTSPVTTGGKIIGAIVAFTGVCVFALPVGIIGAGFVETMDAQRKARQQGALDADPPPTTTAAAAAAESGIAGSAVSTSAGTVATPSVCPHCGHSLTDHPAPSPASPPPPSA